MNKFFLLAVLLVSTLLPPVVLADDNNVPDAVILNRYPVLSADELKQVPFKASIPDNYNPTGVSWNFHNPFRDKTIAGIVISIEYKEPAADKSTVLEIFIRTSCGPLQSQDGHNSFYDAEQTKKASPIIKLKEVHYTPGYS